MRTLSIEIPLKESPVPAKACRLCGARLQHTFVDLGMSPLCETYPSAADLNRGEIYYPLHTYVCDVCFLVQLDQYESPQNIFKDYPYFSSYSDSWLRHCENYCNRMVERFGLNEDSAVIEVGSNDGYLLQYFLQRNVPVQGIEPAANVARAAIQKGIPTLVEFFGMALAKDLAAAGGCADLIAGNNVLAQVPDLHDFIEGLRILLKPGGVLTLEFPHLLKLIEWNEFDTIYHEHFSYFSLLTTVRLMEAHGLRVFDVEELQSHGGSLRVYACRTEDHTRPIERTVADLVATERRAGLSSLEGYQSYAARVKETKLALVEFLLKTASLEKKVAGYGAPGKSATLLHYCGIGKDLIEYTVDRNPHKQGRFLPGTHIPIHHPDRIRETKPDYVVILPWNLKDEIMHQLHYIRDWGGCFVVPIPRVAIY
jgi:SAM-dependent methyltransferase